MMYAELQEKLRTIKDSNVIDYLDFINEIPNATTYLNDNTLNNLLKSLAINRLRDSLLQMESITEEDLIVIGEIIHDHCDERGQRMLTETVLMKQCVSMEQLLKMGLFKRQIESLVYKEIDKLGSLVKTPRDIDIFMKNKIDIENKYTNVLFSGLNKD